MTTRPGQRQPATLDDAGKGGFTAEHTALQDAWDEVQRHGLAPASAEAQDLARRHTEWIASGTGKRQVDPLMLAGVAEMYVADERFAVHYTRQFEFESGARFVRDALVLFAQGLKG